jgi:hypothetical protein
MKIRVRFNKSRGQVGRGTVDHAWRVFAGEKEYLAKHVVFQIPCYSEKNEGSEDWNMVADGRIEIDREHSIIIVAASI